MNMKQERVVPEPLHVHILHLYNSGPVSKNISARILAAQCGGLRGNGVRLPRHKSERRMGPLQNGPSCVISPVFFAKNPNILYM